MTTGLYRHTARLVAAYVAVVTMILSARRIVDCSRVCRYTDSTRGPNREGTSTSAWYEVSGGGEWAWTTSAAIEPMTAFVAGAIGVRSQTARALTRRIRIPPHSSRSGSSRSLALVTTITSWPRRTSSAPSSATWDSTPPTCGWNHGHTWTIRMAVAQ